MGSSACKDVNKFANKIETVADLIRRLQKMPQNARVVDFTNNSVKDVYIEKKYYDDHEEDIVMVY